MMKYKKNLHKNLHKNVHYSVKICVIHTISFVFSVEIIKNFESP